MGGSSPLRHSDFRFPEELRSAFSRDGEYFFAQFEEFTPAVITNVLSDPKIRKGRASQRIWFATSHPKSFCKGISALRFCGWLAVATEADLQKYAGFLSEIDGGDISIECLVNARRLLISEAKYRRIWIDLPRNFSVGPLVNHPLLSETVVENVQTKAMEAMGVRRKVDALAKRLSRQCAKIMDGNCRLVIEDENLETDELSKLLRAFVRGHTRSQKDWDGIRVQFPHKANGKYKDGGWAYFLSVVRLLRDRAGWREILETLRSELALVRSEQPHNLEARSLARSFALAIRTELSERGGEVFGKREEAPVEVSMEAPTETLETAPEEVFHPETFAETPTETKPSRFPKHRPFFPRTKQPIPEPVSVGGKEYVPSLPRTIFHPSNKTDRHAQLLAEFVRMTENGESPVPITELPPDHQSELAWTLSSHGVDFSEGAEMVHERTGIRLVLDRSGEIPAVWAWTSRRDKNGMPAVEKEMF